MQLILDPKLHPELVAMLAAFPPRRRASKVRLMLEAYVSGQTRRQSDPLGTVARLTDESPQRLAASSEVTPIPMTTESADKDGVFLSALDALPM